ncbi:hypothetical protein M569_03352 [Genlisea aurea]|uniref:Bacterial Ig-like domain-containing protein n=1 Tax=Genlisea aurea TaxID=192259 RepID=S8EFM4_9LAMI|nr:hypothetical protein M569_03352 [Genlisea aurea]
MDMAVLNFQQDLGCRHHVKIEDCGRNVRPRITSGVQFRHQSFSFLIFGFGAQSDGTGGLSLKLLRTPHAFSPENYASFSFQPVNSTGGTCSSCSTDCKLDDGEFSVCKGGKVLYTGLRDRNHSFDVCIHGVICTSYSWIVDTIKPTAQITAATTFTNGSHVPVNISFSEPCGGGGGFRCSSVNDCNLLIHGAGEVVPSTLIVLDPNMKYSIVVAISDRVQYGRLILVMDKHFCTDAAGNEFTRTVNSSLSIHFDRRSVFVNLRIHVPEKKLEINGETRTALATNKNSDLRVYLYFTEPVINSSEEILKGLNVNQGSLVSIAGSSLGQRRFGYQLTNISDMAIVTVSLNSDLVISRQGTSVFPVSPVTFIYDTRRPRVKLSTPSQMRSREKIVPVFIKFLKPVFGFDAASISITGGDLHSFSETSRSSYVVHVEVNGDIVSVSIPENVTRDVSGNRNEASNTLQLKHYSVPRESSVISSFATAAFSLTALTSGFLTISTSSLLSSGAFNKPNFISYTDATRSLFRIAGHLQVVAFSRWLAVPLPIEYYELTRGLEWIIPYFNLPWQSDSESVTLPSNFHVLNGLEQQVESSGDVPAGNVSQRLLTPLEYRAYFESQTMIPEAVYLFDPQNSWGQVERLQQNHVLVSSRRGSFPRYEILLLVLAAPSACAASTALVKGGSTSGTIVGVVLLSFVALLTFSLLLFISYGISLGKLVQYKEVHHMAPEFEWYHELIRVTLGPGKRGQWTWKNGGSNSSFYLVVLGPLFEDLRGPPKYMLSRISGGGGGGGSSNGSIDRIIESDDETEDAEAPFIQKLFGILRIYYGFVEFSKRVVVGGMAGACYSGTWESRTPAAILVSVTGFQLVFLILKKPFIGREVQLAEIVSVSFETAIFGICFLLTEFSPGEGEMRKLGLSMAPLFLIAFLTQMAIEWRGLFDQARRLDPVSGSFLRGVSAVFAGWAALLLRPHGPVEKFESGSKRRDSSSDKPWMKQLSALARSSFNKTATANEASTSRTKWSGGGSSPRSGGVVDEKSKSGALHRELEEIFASSK